MNDYISILKNDLVNLTNDLKEKKIISNNFDNSNISIDYLSTSKKGDLSTNLLILLNKNIINKEIKIEKLIEDQINKFLYINHIEIANKGFINIFFKKDYIVKHVNNIILNPDHYGKSELGKNKKINVEFVSANPTGPIHIAHMRGAVLGDVISSILENTGYNITREYYVNDSGSQVKTLGNSLYKRYQELFNIKIEILENEYPGEYLIEIAKEIIKTDNDKWLNKNLKDRELFFEKYAVDYLIKTIKKDLESINIIFDKFTFESSIINNKVIDKIFDILEKKDLLYEGLLKKPKGDDSTNWSPRKQLLFRSSKFYDDQDRPFKKVDNEWTYFANDAAYHYDKFSRKYDNLINIWGADHIGYINRMKSLVEAFSEKSNYLDIHVCQIVRLLENKKILKMSKRLGNFISLKDILSKVGKDSIRYFMVSAKSETPMDFDIKKVIEKNKNNPVFYCQYAYARSSSIINKSQELDEFKEFYNNIDLFDYSTLTKAEHNIILKILSWPYLLYQSSIYRQPHRITNYLENICSDFHSFWNMGKDDKNLKIIDPSNINKTISKLIWIKSFRIVLKRAFDIIGIESNEVM